MMMATGGGELIQLSRQKPDDSTILFKSRTADKQPQFNDNTNFLPPFCLQ